jgi:hypothetical protein
MEQTLYLCKIHPETWSIDIRGVEQHCKYQEPDTHRAEILRVLSITEHTKKDHLSNTNPIDVDLH